MSDRPVEITDERLRELICDGLKHNGGLRKGEVREMARQLLELRYSFMSAKVLPSMDLDRVSVEVSLPDSFAKAAQLATKFTDTNPIVERLKVMGAHDCELELFKREASAVEAELTGLTLKAFLSLMVDDAKALEKTQEALRLACDELEGWMDYADGQAVDLGQVEPASSLEDRAQLANLRELLPKTANQKEGKPT